MCRTWRRPPSWTSCPPSEGKVAAVGGVDLWLSSSATELASRRLTFNGAPEIHKPPLPALCRLAVVHFWAPWSQPCQQMNEAMSELAEEHANVRFLKVS